ncbi:MAG: PEP-CTERM sorting domain-containing protein [Phycisphaeraceae bacterium]
MFRANSSIKNRVGQCGLVLVVVALFAAQPAFAAPLVHGDFEGASVWFNDVREDSATDTPPLYQEVGESITVSSSTVGGTTVDRLNFSPDADFAAFAPQAGGLSSDTTDGVLRFTLEAKEGQTITGVELSEFGDWSITVLVDGQGLVTVGGALFAEEGGNLAQTSIAASGLPGPTDSTSSGTWNGSAELDLSNFSGQTIDIVINNTLQAAADDATAFIAKKGFQVDVTSVPEPGTLLLMASGALLMLRRRGTRAKAVTA